MQGLTLSPILSVTHIGYNAYLKVSFQLSSNSFTLQIQLSMRVVIQIGFIQIMSEGININFCVPYKISYNY